MRRFRLSALAYLVGYVLMAAAVCLLLFEARRRTIAALDSPAARADWLRWKAEAEREAKSGGPVRRRPPKSQEPPSLILLRDHFGGVLTSVLAITTCLYVFLAIVIRGASEGRRAPQGAASKGMREANDFF